MTDYSDVQNVLAATVSGKDVAEANARIDEWKETDLPLFQWQMSCELANEELATELRQQAAIQLKNSLSGNDEIINSELAALWMDIDEDSRNQIKNQVFDVLGTDDVKARRGAAQVIAKIAAIEIPKHAWDDLIYELLQNLIDEKRNQNDGLKISSLETLGYLCEDLEIDHLSEEDATDVISAMVNGLRSEEKSIDVRIAAAEALDNALDFATPVFQRESERTYLMDLLFESCIHDNLELRVATMDCLVSVAAIFYDYMFAHIQDAFDVTYDAIKEDDEKVCLRAIEFWSTICDEELLIMEEAEAGGSRVCQHYIKGVSEYLVPLLLDLLKEQDEDAAYDPDAWNRSMAAATCLQQVSNTAKDAVVDMIMEFVETNVESEDWHDVEAAAMAFGSMMEGPSAEVMHDMVKEGATIFTDLLQYPKVDVKDTAAWTLGRIIKFFHDLISQKQYDEMFEQFRTCLLDEPPRVASNVCWAISNLAAIEMQVAASSESGHAKTGIVSAEFVNIVSWLLDASDREDADENHLLAGCFETVNMMIKSGADDTIDLIVELTDDILARLEATLDENPTNQDDINTLAELQALLASCIQCITEKLGDQMKGISGRIMDDFLSVLEHTQDSTVQEEVLMAIGVLANNIEGDMENYLADMMEFVNVALEEYQNWQVCIVTLGVVGDLCRACTSAMESHVEHLINHLYTIINARDAHTSVTPLALTTFGDIAMAIGGGFQDFKNDVSQLLQQVADFTISADDDPRTMNYHNKLRDALFETYTGILQGLAIDEKSELMLDEIPTILSVVQVVYSDENTTDEVLRSAVNVIGDIANTMGDASAKSLKRQEVVIQIINFCARSKNKKLREDAKWARDAVRRVIDS
eukprot:TRINITY_DN4156_c0_g1_i6.p1 TRINITY_DN4156_c0_g1~~TRINITY_DN4156_c0_g1_i6.p1  ORF type:complete len:930 (+),score=348.10 TRINITY_DN4156_c0_g1_i6:188-2791(+)